MSCKFNLSVDFDDTFVCLSVECSEDGITPGDLKEKVSEAYFTYTNHKPADLDMYCIVVKEKIVKEEILYPSFFECLQIDGITGMKKLNLQELFHSVDLSHNHNADADTESQKSDLKEQSFLTENQTNETQRLFCSSQQKNERFYTQVYLDSLYDLVSGADVMKAIERWYQAFSSEFSSSFKRGGKEERDLGFQDYCNVEQYVLEKKNLPFTLPSPPPPSYSIHPFFDETECEKASRGKISSHFCQAAAASTPDCFPVPFGFSNFFFRLFNTSSSSFLPCVLRVEDIETKWLRFVETNQKISAMDNTNTLSSSTLPPLYFTNSSTSPSSPYCFSSSSSSPSSLPYHVIVFLRFFCNVWNLVKKNNRWK